MTFFIALISLSMVVYGLEKGNAQDVLLDFYAQETVSHGVMFFGASAAAFTFIVRLVRKVKNAKQSLIFMFFSGILLGLVIFLGFRVMYYGSLCNEIITDDKYYNETKLYNYSSLINDEIKKNITSDDPIGYATRNLVKATRQGINNFNPFAILPISMYLSFFFSYLIYFGFTPVNNCITIFDWKFWFWLIFFLIPVVLGLLGAALFNWSNIKEFKWLTIGFLIYYMSVPFAIVIAERKKWGNRISSKSSVIIILVVVFIWIVLNIFGHYYGISGFFGFSDLKGISMNIGYFLVTLMFIFILISRKLFIENKAQT